MNLDEKSIAYAFIANGVQIYINDENENAFLISRLVCMDCGAPWYTNLTECFLCGAINPYLFQCRECGTFQSITKSDKNKCNNCGEKDTLVMACANPDCISNTSKITSTEIAEKGGVFNKESGFSISQQHCLECGSKYHMYKNYSVIVRTCDTSAASYAQLNIPADSEEDICIVRHKVSSSTIEYSVINLGNSADIRDIEKPMFSNFEELVEFLYPQEQSTYITQK